MGDLFQAKGRRRETAVSILTESNSLSCKYFVIVTMPFGHTSSILVANS